MEISTQEAQLCEFLRDLPLTHKNRFTENTTRDLLYNLFWSLAGGQDAYMRLLFPEGPNKTPTGTWKLREAQGAVDGAEYTEAARGKACGHIFKNGEATYRCRTCSADETCVLCSRCYDSSDHTGHMVYISISPGNSGCCDCGDPEAWRLPVHCTIHSEDETKSRSSGKEREAAGLPDDLVESIRMTIGRAFDYVCDVISCSPEQLRLPKTLESVMADERHSRLSSKYYRGDIPEDPVEYAVLLWNDEKHTVVEVQEQVARACKISKSAALVKAHETDDIGRSIIKYGTDLSELLKISRIIEQIKVTVTIRSARDTFREQMCGAIVEWLGDISGCSVGNDHDILRHVVCEEMLKAWRMGSEASNAIIGKNGLDDHTLEKNTARIIHVRQAEILMAAMRNAEVESDDDEELDVDPDMLGMDEIDNDDDDDAANTIELMIIDNQLDLEEQADAGDAGDAGDAADLAEMGDVEMEEEDPALENQEATMAGYAAPPPPPPPAPPAPSRRDRDLTPSDSDTAEPLIPASVYDKANLEIPRTPKVLGVQEQAKPARYWLETSESFKERESIPMHEDLWQRVRLDWLILFDLRMWKKVRVDLRDLYISTVVTIPQFKRVLGLRFAGLYTMLAQLYLVADREPDHSIINISLQMLTTPSITTEIVERGNFLTNLMAILYTFLTTRQVGHPDQIKPNATLAFDSGSVTNRRMYHFFMDLRYLFGSEHVQEQLRTESRYMMQFFDLVKLHQGICPNVRAVGDHVEYETDAWISASLITREINRLCRQFAESFKWQIGEDPTAVSQAIRTAMKITILNSLGTERRRFVAAEIKDEIKFKKIGDFEFGAPNETEHYVVKFSVADQPISFHHALHYTLSWLIECGKSLTKENLRQLLSFTTEELTMKPKSMGMRTMPSHEFTPEDHLMAVFDYPLRVCAWLAQMRASMWVRNGMSLRHQAATYRGVGQRDVSHHRDIFLLQTALVMCSPSRVLATMIDRFGMEKWMQGIYEQDADKLDDSQVLDVAEDLVHLLIVLLSDRTSLVAIEDEPNPHMSALRRDITHVLCFKPLSFTDICSKLPDKFQEQEECQDILDDMTTFKPPEGLSDVGTFELREQFFEDIDPYIAHYSKNQREEAENAYKVWKAKKTGKAPEDVVYEPHLKPIPSGIFSGLSAFTGSGIFSQIVFYALLYALKAQQFAPTVPITRVETFLHVVLHLVLIAVMEDKTAEDDPMEEANSFIYTALTKPSRSPFGKTIVSVLEALSDKEEFKSCQAKITLILKRMKQKRPHSFETAYARLGVPTDRLNTASPANLDGDLAVKEQKKQQALARQAKVMASFQQQQKNFLDNQGDIDWGEELTDEEVEEVEERKNFWKFPSGTCILCQEETSDARPYGTFALISDSCILRQTDLKDPDFIREAASTPVNLDHSAEHLRPFGVSGENREKVRKVTSTGDEKYSERQGIGKGFPPRSSRMGPITVGCGHIMHYHCFELYYSATTRRHQHQIARHHPEKVERNEFVCPLCKALGNVFLPIIWRGKEEAYPGTLQTEHSFDTWLNFALAPSLGRQEKSSQAGDPGNVGTSWYQDMFRTYHRDNLMPFLETKTSQLLIEAWETPHRAPPPPPFRAVAAALNIDPAETSRDPQEATMPELISIYRRLKETLRLNGIGSDHKYDREQNKQNDLAHTDVLARSLGYSIAAAEIQQRGMESSSETTLLGNISQQSLTHLRILSETTSSYISVGGLRLAGTNRACNEFSRDHDRQMFQLFIGHPQIIDLNSPDLNFQVYEPLLRQDPFIFLTQCAACFANVSQIDIMHIIRLCYIAEMVRVVMAVHRQLPADVASQWMFPASSESDDSSSSFREFCTSIIQIDRELRQLSGVFTPDLQGDKTFDNDKDFLGRVGSFQSFCQKYALTFLRKCTILLHVRFGVDFSNFIPSNPDADELTRLTEMLRIDDFDSICASLNEKPADSATPPVILSMVQGWVRHHFIWRDPKTSAISMREEPIQISHPGVFELIGLPKNYDTLMEEVMRRKCPTVPNKDISDPFICLFCGDIFCGQSICCLKEEAHPGSSSTALGGCNRHMRKYVYPLLNIEVFQHTNRITATANGTWDCSFPFANVLSSTSQTQVVAGW
jgi:E3 ubiquitin-protein ligase UBR1